jgi:hypothetical protein
VDIFSPEHDELLADLSGSDGEISGKTGKVRVPFTDIRKLAARFARHDLKPIHTSIG